MTVIVGKNSINIGWTTAVTIVIFLIYNTYRGTKFIIDSETNQSTMQQDVKEMKAALKLIAKRDSVYPVQIAKIGARVDSLVEVGCCMPARTRTRSQGFVYEIKTKRGIVLKPVQ